MALNIKDDEADRLARELAGETGVTITAAVTHALKEELRRVRAAPAGSLEAEIERIALRCATLPLVDDRSDDEILGYDRHGLPR